MQRYSVKLTGATPLLMHYDNLAWEETMKAWRLDPANKQASVAGDDRTPAWRWLGYLYVEAGRVVMPSDNLMTMLREGGRNVGTGKRQQTFKALTQSGIIIDQSAWAFTVGGGAEIFYKDLKPLIGNANFEEHLEKAVSLGFELFVKRAKIGQSKHVRVRPRFDTWATAGTLTVLDDAITPEVLKLIIDNAGAYGGLCDWRPSSPKSPGPFGKFLATIEAI